MVDHVLNKIREIETLKKESKTVPSHVMYIELLKATGIKKEELNNSLNRLYKNNQIEAGQSINDKWIKIK